MAKEWYVVNKDKLEEECKRFGKRKIKRIYYSQDSEDRLLWNMFSPIPESKEVVNEILKASGLSSFSDKLGSVLKFKFWYGRVERILFPPKTHDKWLRNYLLTSNLPIWEKRAKNPRQLEGPTEPDLILDCEKGAIFIEAKLWSDISCSTTYGVLRDQISRIIDVGTYWCQENNKEFIFILLALEYNYLAKFRYYSFVLNEYRSNPDEAVKLRLPYRGDLMGGKLASRIGFLSWEKMYGIHTLYTSLSKRNESLLKNDFKEMGIFMKNPQRLK